MKKHLLIIMLFVLAAESMIPITSEFPVEVTHTAAGANQNDSSLPELRLPVKLTHEATGVSKDSTYLSPDSHDARTITAWRHRARRNTHFRRV